MLQPEDCYRVLGVDSDASEEEIREAYRDLVKVWHPDRFNHDPDLYRKAQERLREINEAFDTLERHQGTEANGRTATSRRKARKRRPDFWVSNAPRPVVYGRIVYVAFLLGLAGAAGWLFQGGGLSVLMGSPGARSLIDAALSNTAPGTEDSGSTEDASPSDPPAIDLDEAVGNLRRLAAAEGIEDVIARYEAPAKPAAAGDGPDAIVFEWSVGEEDTGPGFEPPAPTPRRGILDDAPEEMKARLASRTPDQRARIESACLMSHRRGADAFERCLEFQLRRNPTPRPGLDLTALDATLRRAIEKACDDWRHRGTVLYQECLRREHRSLVASESGP